MRLNVHDFVVLVISFCSPRLALGHSRPQGKDDRQEPAMEENGKAIRKQV